ncbi:hypothetical protein [Chitinophaga sp. XS-30]|uniref:hypothetical protein n=1 Tax=Chitinophaga sp. XS-30 TaxID=2604421 RepID=UPI0011DD6200|nr:hypothetical protein [Chitinophaga sp. XS-30]QEH39658.1 hypothetical protein FW415_01755 [Chitinophaga sp. XS-30]
MRIRYILRFFALILLTTAASAQKVTYSEPERDDYKTTEFEIIGRISGNILVYKADRGDYNISVYDNGMQLKDRVKLDFLPKKLISVDFVGYQDKAYMIYQFQRRDAVYSFVGKLNGNGVFETAPVMVDSTRIGNYSKENKVYSVEVSEDKERILLYKINQDKEDNHVFYTFLYDSNFNLVNNSRVSLPMEAKRQFLSNFNLNNEGDLVFTKLERGNSRDYIVSGNLVVKRAVVDSFEVQPFEVKGILLDEIKVKLDNNSKQALVTAFYYERRRGNVEGIYMLRLDLATKQKIFEKATAFSPELKQNARGESSAPSAFNDYFIRKIVFTKDGGFLMTAEAYYTTSRTQPWNRWNYMYGGMGGMGGYYPYYYSPYSPYYYNPYGWNDMHGTRYHYDNIAILSFDEKGEMQYSNFVHKSQFDDGADLYLSYMLVNVGSELHFLFNELDRRQYVLSENTIGPDGKVSRKPTLRNLDKGFTWMPRYGKQIAARTVIIPCIYRNYICFAKIDF